MRKCLSPKVQFSILFFSYITLNDCFSVMQLKFAKDRLLLPRFMAKNDQYNKWVRKKDSDTAFLSIVLKILRLEIWESQL